MLAKVKNTNSILLPVTLGTQWVSTSLGKAKPVDQPQLDLPQDAQGSPRRDRRRREGQNQPHPKACKHKKQPEACYLDSIISSQSLYLTTQAKQYRNTQARKCKKENGICAWTQGPFFNRSDVLHTNVTNSENRFLGPLWALWARARTLMGPLGPIWGPMGPGQDPYGALWAWAKTLMGPRATALMDNHA